MARTDSDSVRDQRPVVRTVASSNYGMWAFVAVLLLGGAWLFATLNSAREASDAPRAFATGAAGPRIASPPPLALPPDGRRLPLDLGPEGPVLLRQVPPSSGAAPRLARSESQPPVAPYSPPYQPPVEPPIIYTDTPTPPTGMERGGARQPDPPPVADQSGNRVLAARLANPSFTVPQGTLIPAVLETGFNSTRQGRARALVQRNVYGFDGTRVLIPRGSRLYGEYQAGINPGERRAQITWTRLIRPDGVTVALDSPAADQLGRAGVEGDVNSRFLARFGSALLQSVLDIGVGVATRSSSDGVIVAMPGSTQNITGDAAQVRPVLVIDPGASVAVHVARDLDFSSVDR
ncbi:TrbI/VirB10 family protein [Aurantiacibacter arachoides]|nr:TrbI/VirB10 family protein [Aurantiacibacter arachoides]